MKSDYLDCAHEYVCKRDVIWCLYDLMNIMPAMEYRNNILSNAIRAIEKIQGIQEGNMTLGEFLEETTPIEEDVADAADADHSGGWIPIDESLPWKSDVYLVVVTPPMAERQVGVCYYDQDELRFTSVGWNSWQRYGFVDPKCITHWRELPKLPEVNSNGR